MRCFALFLLTSLCLIPGGVVLACDVCQRQQPKFLGGITHGAGPQNDWDYVIVAAMVLIAFISLVYAVWWTFKPGEKDKKHIKYSIFNPVDP